MDFFHTFESLMGFSIMEMLISDIPTALANLAVYIFTGLGLYTIAKRRGIHNPWLAWVPFANMWLLGCISDHYQSVAKGKVRRRRVVLVVANVLMTLVAIAVLVLCFVMFARMFAIGFEIFGDALPDLENMESMMNEAQLEELMSTILGPAIGMVLLALVLLPIGIVYLVFYCMALSDVYKSCEPDNAALYLVLSILISICTPIFLMVCRNKDLGMPVAAPQPAYNPYEQNPYQPPYGMPPQPPVPEKDPWEE